MSAQTLLTLLRQLVTTGELTVVDGELHFNGEAIRPDPPTDTGYRKDGWATYADEYGCRRHRIVDELLDKMSRGTRYERQVAEEAEYAFCFDVRRFGLNEGQVHSIEAEDREARERSRDAAWLALAGYIINVPQWSYRLREDGQNTVVPGRLVVLSSSRIGDSIVDKWPQRYAESLEEQAEGLRVQAERGW